MQKFYIQTLGCQMNYADSDRVREVLWMSGLTETQEVGEADVAVLNTCTVRQGAADRATGFQISMRELKERKPGAKWVLTGCLVERTAVRGDEKQDALLRQLKLLDVALRIEDVGKLPKLLGLDKSIEVADYLSILPSYKNKLMALVPIMTGCNNFCAYCAVPYARGRERSRSVEEVLQEVQKALKEGAKEIHLLGQNVNSYAFGFAGLLGKINALPGKFWIKFTSSHPKDCSVELLEVMSRCEKVVPHLHLPVQAGCDKTLRDMKRNYTTAQYAKIAEEYRRLVPQGSLTSDWIVGFCGETREDFEASLKFCDEMKFDLVFLAQYSPRPHTFASEHMDDNVGVEEKEKRWHELNAVVLKNAFARNEEMIGREVEVLISEVVDGVARGRIGQDKQAEMRAEGVAVGDFVRGRVTGVRKWILETEKLPD